MPTTSPCRAGGRRRRPSSTDLGFVARYDTKVTEDGLPPGEGTFLPCTFWYADNLAMQGRREEATAIFDRSRLRGPVRHQGDRGRAAAGRGYLPPLHVLVCRQPRHAGPAGGGDGHLRPISASWPGTTPR